jgi:hypothetical protein
MQAKLVLSSPDLFECAFGPWPCQASQSAEISGRNDLNEALSSVSILESVDGKVVIATFDSLTRSP